jgi:hypothetical protein
MRGVMSGVKLPKQIEVLSLMLSRNSRGRG